MLNSRRASIGETVAQAAALLLLVISFLPYWASLEIVSSELVVFDGPSRFSLWDAYPPVVSVAVFVGAAIVGRGIVRMASGKALDRPAPLYAGGGAIVTLLLLYGLIEGPSRLLENPLYQLALHGDGPVTFELQRGPLLYVGLAASVAILIGGLFALRDGRQAEHLRSAKQTPKGALEP